MNNSEIEEFFYSHYKDSIGKRDSYFIIKIEEKKMKDDFSFIDRDDVGVGKIGYLVHFVQKLSGMRFSGRYFISLDSIREEKIDKILNGNL